MFNLTDVQIKKIIENTVNFDNTPPMTFLEAGKKYAQIQRMEGIYGYHYNLQEMLEHIAKKKNSSYERQEYIYQMWLEKQHNAFFMEKAEKYRDFLLSMMSKLRDMGIKDEDEMMKKLHQEWEDVETAYMSNDCIERFLKEMKLYFQ